MPYIFTAKIDNMSQNPNLPHRRSIRLKGYDYSQEGLYFITVCVAERACLFGSVENGEMVLNEFGEIARNELLKTTDIRPNLEIDSFVIMPNHVHCIIHITGDDFRRGELHSPGDENREKIIDKLHSPDNQNGIVQNDESHYSLSVIAVGSPDNQIGNDINSEFHLPNEINIENDIADIQEGKCNLPLPMPPMPHGTSQTVGTIVRGYKSAVTKQLNTLGFSGKLWQRNYYEHIIRTPESYDRIANYIENNPTKWEEDKFYNR